MEQTYVLLLLACGVSFTEIATVMGVSRQAVHKRYAGPPRIIRLGPDGSLIPVSQGGNATLIKAYVNDR